MQGMIAIIARHTIHMISPSEPDPAPWCSWLVECDCDWNGRGVEFRDAEIAHAAHVAAALEAAGYGKRPEPIDPDKATIMNGWLVVEYGSCTCGGGDSASGYHHESGCGYEPLMNITDILNATGYKIVEGEKEWGVRLSDGSVEEVHDQSAAELVCLDWPSTEAVVSRTVTAWKKEA